MYAGLDQEGRLVHVKEALQGQVYQCPRCHQDLFIRKSNRGKVTFCHRFTCGQRPHNPRQIEESDYHKQAKQWLASGSNSASIEHWIGASGQQADVFIEPNLVIEYQRSKISSDLLASRHRDYCNLGLKVMWVISNKSFSLKNLTRWQKATLQYHPNRGFHWWVLDESTGTLYLYGKLPILYPIDQWELSKWRIPLKQDWLIQNDLSHPCWETHLVKRKYKKSPVSYQVAIAKSETYRDLLHFLANYQLYLLDAPKWFFDRYWKCLLIQGPAWVVLVLTWAWIKRLSPPHFSTQQFMNFLQEQAEAELFQFNSCPLVSFSTLKPLALSLLSCFSHYGFISFNKGLWMVL